MSEVAGVLPGRSVALRVPGVLAVCALLAGCSVGNVGLLGARVADFDGGQSVEVHAPGLHLRGRADDPGASLGYTRRVYYFGGAGALAPGWHFFRIPLPDAGALALERRSLGIELATAEPEAGLAIGYEQVIVQARVPSDASMVLEYAPGGRTPFRYVQCGSPASCDSTDLLLPPPPSSPR